MTAVFLCWSSLADNKILCSAGQPAQVCPGCGHRFWFETYNSSFIWKQLRHTKHWASQWAHIGVVCRDLSVADPFPCYVASCAFFCSLYFLLSFRLDSPFHRVFQHIFWVQGCSVDNHIAVSGFINTKLPQSIGVTLVLTPALPALLPVHLYCEDHASYFETHGSVVYPSGSDSELSLVSSECHSVILKNKKWATDTCIASIFLKKIKGGFRRVVLLAVLEFMIILAHPAEFWIPGVCPHAWPWRRD